MSKGRRWALVAASGAVVGLLTAGAASASFATGLTPGNTKFSNEAIYASFFDAQGNQISIEAHSGLQSFRPRGGGPAITEDTTMVRVLGYIVSSGIFGDGCWITPSRPFAIRSSDKSATFSFDSSAPGVTECPGLPLNTGEVVPSSLRLTTLAEGVTGAVVITATWTPVGVAAQRRDTVNTTCGAFGAVSQMDSMSQNSTAATTVSSFTVEGVDLDTQETVDVSLAGSYTTDFALVNTASFSQTVNGPSTGDCGPFGSDTP